MPVAGERSAMLRSLTNSAAVLGIALTAALAGAQQASDETPPLQAGRIAGQVALGTVGTLGGFIGGGLATRWAARRMGASQERASRLAYVGAWSASALATAGGATLLGRHGPVTGSYTAALGGLCDNEGAGSRCGALGGVAGLAVFLLPSIGATVGFNASREYR